MLTLTAAAAALAFGINGQTVTPVDHEKSLSTSDIVIAADDTATNGDQHSSPKNDGDNAKGSAKMGEEEGTQTGANQGATPEMDSQKIDQSARKNPTTSN